MSTELWPVQNVSYQIEQVQSGDASFKVYADRNDLGQISYMATELANKNRANKKTKELVDEAAKNPFVLASDQDAREAGINIGGRFFGDRVDASSVTSTSLDIDGDGVMEFVTAMRVNYSSGDSNWYVFASYQYPKGPGEKNSVEFAGEGAIEEISVEPSSYEMQGKNLVATMADGSKKSLVHHTSTEAYQAYIKANGGNPAASITPSAMSVTASLGAAQVVAPATGAARGAGVIDAAIAAQAKQDGGSEHTQARKLAKGDIDGDGIPDLAVLFTLQGVGGEDRSVSYLAGFVAKAGQLKLVDTVSVGNAKGMHLEKDGAVRLTLLMPGPDNAQVAVEDNYMLNENTWMLVQAHP